MRAKPRESRPCDEMSDGTLGWGDERIDDSDCDPRRQGAGQRPACGAAAAPGAGRGPGPGAGTGGRGEPARHRPARGQLRAAAGRSGNAGAGDRRRSSRRRRALEGRGQGLRPAGRRRLRPIRGGRRPTRAAGSRRAGPGAGGGAAGNRVHCVRQRVRARRPEVRGNPAGARRDLRHRRGGDPDGEGRRSAGDRHFPRSGQGEGRPRSRRRHRRGHRRG